MIVDAHIHIHPIPTPDNGLKMPERYEQAFRKDLATVGIPPDRQAETAIERMDAAGVDVSIVVNPYHLPSTGHVRTNVSVYETIKPYKGRIYSLAGIYVQPEADVKELRHAITDFEYHGLKLTLSGQVRPIDFERLDPVYKTLIEYDLPVVWHPGPSAFGVMQPSYIYDMRDYYDLARRHPDLKIVIAHCGNGTLGSHDMAMNVAMACKNVYLETSAIFHRLAAEHMPPDSKSRHRNFTANYLYPEGGEVAPGRQQAFEDIKRAYIRFIRACCNRAPGKLIYGTDIPFADRWDVSIPVYQEAIPDEEIYAEVMGETARKVYRL